MQFYIFTSYIIWNQILMKYSVVMITYVIIQCHLKQTYFSLAKQWNILLLNSGNKLLVYNFSLVWYFLGTYFMGHCLHRLNWSHDVGVQTIWISINYWMSIHEVKCYFSYSFVNIVKIPTMWVLKMADLTRNELHAQWPVAGIRPLPESLCMNLAKNWKLFKQKWYNYVIICTDNNNSTKLYYFSIRWGMIHWRCITDFLFPTMNKQRTPKKFSKHSTGM